MPLSVLIVNHSYGYAFDSTARYASDLATSLAADGWAVTILCAQNSPEIPPERVHIRCLGYKHRPRGLVGHSILWLRMWLKFRMTSRHDIVITLSDPPLVALAIAGSAKRRKMRHIHWMHAMYPALFNVEGVGLSRFMERFLNRRMMQMMRTADKVVAVGRCMAKKLVQEGMEPAHISVIPNWIPTRYHQQMMAKPAPEEVQSPAELANAKEDARNQRTVYFDDVQRFRMLHTADVNRTSAISPVLRVASNLGQEHPDMEFICVGRGLGHEVLAQERARLGLDNLKLLPPQPADKYADLMVSGDIHLLTLKNEALGLSVPSEVFQAFASGRPIVFVGPEESDPAKLIRSYQAGHVIDPDDTALLEATLIRYRYDPQTWYEAHQGAIQAGQVFRPEESLNAWKKRVSAIVRGR